MKTKTKEIKNSWFSLIFMILLFPMLLLSATSYESGEENFYLVNPEETRNIVGNTLIIGNTVECVTGYYYLNKKDYNLPNSLDQLQFADCENDLYKNDNNYFVKYIDIDNNSTTFNSSNATVKFPSTYKEIAWAGLFWQGHINNYSYQYYNDGWSLSNDFPEDIEHTNANKIQLKIGNGSYEEIEALRLDYFDEGNGAEYSAYADITNNIKNSNIVSDTNVTIANIVTTKGLETSLGDYGAWTLVIVYKENADNVNSKLRNNSVYYGYKVVSNGNPNTITITDFLLPKSGTIDSQMAVFAAEGEYTYAPDTIKLDDNELGAETCTTELNDPSCKTNIFDAKLSPSIERYPTLTNSNGIDIDVFDTSSIMTAKRDANPNATSYTSTISLTSDWDLYFPSMVSFTTELYKPRVCYYVDKIIDENNQTVYENKNFTQDLVQNQQYKISLWIANMKKDSADTDIEIAKKVKVSVDYKDFEYLNESTFIKNIYWNSFNHITDILNDDIGEFLNDLNQSNWRVGDGATSTSGGTISPAIDFNDDTNKVFVDINGTFKIDNNTTQINLDDIFTVKASYATDILEIINPIPIPKCQDFNTTGNAYIPTLGSFNVVNKTYAGGIVPSDVNDSINALYTQVVNNSFEVKVVSLDNDLETPKNIDALISVDLIKNPADESQCLNNDALIESNVTFNNQSYKSLNLSYPKADKDLRFRIKYLVDQYGSIIDWNGIGACSNNTGTIYNDYACIWGLLTSRVYDNAICNEGNGYTESQCPCATVCNPATNDSPNHNEECVRCVFGDPNLSKSTCSRDNFAIRPNEFNFNIAGISPYKAGKDYNISFVALDENNNTVNDYNETTNSSFKIDINETKTGCKTGAFNPNINSTWNFIDGNKTIQSNYSEVGTLNIKIQEINGSEFAKVDADDTSDIQRLIASYDKNLTFIPDHFSLNAKLSNSGNNYTYISNDLNMSATLDINITAKTENNTTTKNYNSACYAQKTDYNISYTNLSILPLNSLSKVIYSETNTSIYGSININSDINLTIPNTIFSTDNNGTGTIHVNINFDRNKTKVVNPFTLNIKDINVTDTNNTAGNIVLDKNTTFYYGRVHAPDQRFEGNSGTAKIYYEVYCDSCNKVDFNITGSESIDSINWFINTLHTSNDGNVTYAPLNANTLLNITNSTNVANGQDSTTITVPANSLPYKDKIRFNPSSTWLIYNPTDFLIEFYGTGKWAGQGIQGKTIDLNISRKQNKRLDW